MGWTIRPWPLKKRDTSSPRSARRAIASAETGLADLRVFFIQSDLLLGRSPQCDEMQDLALFVFPGFEYDRVQPIAHPANGQKLLRNVGSPIEPIRLGEQIPRLLEPNATPGIRPEAPALSRIEAKAHLI